MVPSCVEARLPHLRKEGGTLTVDDALNALLSMCTIRIQGRTSNSDGFGTEGKGLDGIGSSADAAIDHDFHLVE